MEPSGRNRWQLVADARSAKFVQSSRNRCRRLRPLAAGTPWAVPWREAWPARDRGPPAEQRQRAARPRRPRRVYRRGKQTTSMPRSRSCLAESLAESVDVHAVDAAWTSVTRVPALLGFDSIAVLLPELDCLLEFGERFLRRTGTSELVNATSTDADLASDVGRLAVSRLTRRRPCRAGRGRFRRRARLP